MITSALPLIRCIAHVPGCELCTTEPLRFGAGHVCDDLCEVQRHNRASEAGHARTHEPRRHECGAILDDRRGNIYEIQRFCGWGTCVQYFCPGCRRFIAGFGPVGCQCEERPCGHGSYHEYARPGSGKLKKKSIFSRRRK